MDRAAAGGGSHLVGVGIAIGGLSPAEGALVTFVAPGGPADRAGLVAGDRILSADGQPVVDPKRPHPHPTKALDPPPAKERR